MAGPCKKGARGDGDNHFTLGQQGCRFSRIGRSHRATKADMACGGEYPTQLEKYQNLFLRYECFFGTFDRLHPILTKQAYFARISRMTPYLSKVPLIVLLFVTVVFVAFHFALVAGNRIVRTLAVTVDVAIAKSSSGHSVDHRFFAGFGYSAHSIEEYHVHHFHCFHNPFHIHCDAKSGFGSGADCHHYHIDRPGPCAPGCPNYYMYLCTTPQSRATLFFFFISFY